MGQRWMRDYMMLSMSNGISKQAGGSIATLGSIFRRNKEGKAYDVMPLFPACVTPALNSVVSL